MPELTTARTVRAGSVLRQGTERAYRRLTHGPGEPHLRRLDLAPGARDASDRPPGDGRSLLHFLHLTDLQLVDAQSPARMEFLDRVPDREGIRHLIPAHRAHEALSVQAFEALVRTARALRSAGAPLDLAVSTGDAIDNQQRNELQWFLTVMEGGRVTPNSGGPRYEGVQAKDWRDPEYWHPDPLPDSYKERWGFPEYPGLLEEAIQPFVGEGLGLPWLSCFGNHEGLVQGTAIPTLPVQELVVGERKPIGLPTGFDPVANVDAFVPTPEAFLSGPSRPVTADPDRRFLARRDFVDAHLRIPGRPAGHGFTAENRDRGTTYYVHDGFPGVRLVVLDTTNPGGFYEGSVGAAQLAWLEHHLADVHSRFFDRDGSLVETGATDRLVILFSHHGLETMTNPTSFPNPLEPEGADTPRALAGEIERMIHRFGNVVLWVNGHTHENRIRPRPDPEGKTAGFWDVTTCAVMDWPSQARLVRLLGNEDGTLSVRCTMIDHDGPPDPGRAEGLWRLASIHRELAANRPYRGASSEVAGEPTDRNVELVLPVAVPR